jgi:hypothetical protein
MTSVDLERLVPGLADQLAQERQNRALAFAGLTHTVCGREILPLTPGHRLTLQLLGNAFTQIGRTPTLADVFVFLWVTSPHNIGGLEAKRQQYFLRQDVMAFNLSESAASIFQYIVDQLQDTSSGSGEGKDQSRWVHWMAMDSFFYMSQIPGLTLAEYKRTPFLVLQQIYRAWQCNHPDMERTQDGTVFVREPMFQNSSDRLVRQWHRQHKEAVKKHILAQKTRRN